MGRGRRQNASGHALRSEESAASQRTIDGRLAAEETVVELARRLGAHGLARDRGAPCLLLGRGSVTLSLAAEDDELVLVAIDAHPQGTGLGTRVVRELIALARERSLRLRVTMIHNFEFFDSARFPELRDHHGDLVFDGASASPPPA